jgi:hypothetical protein
MTGISARFYLPAAFVNLEVPPSIPVKELHTDTIFRLELGAGQALEGTSC